MGWGDVAGRRSQRSRSTAPRKPPPPPPAAAAAPPHVFRRGRVPAAVVSTNGAAGAEVRRPLRPLWQPFD
jgi:hypothetical protein